MTPRLLALTSLAIVIATVLTGCGGGHSNQPTAQERDLGPVSTKVLGGTADSRYLHVFSASISLPKSGSPQFSATLLYVGTGSDRLINVSTPLGSSHLTQALNFDSPVPISVALRGTQSHTAASGTTVPVSVRLATHGSVDLVVPVLGPAPTVSSSP